MQCRSKSSNWTTTSDVLSTSTLSLSAAYRGNIREAAERQRAGIKVEQKLTRNIANLKRRLSENQVLLDGLKAREQSIREKFGAELDRYRYLVGAQAQAEN